MIRPPASSVGQHGLHHEIGAVGSEAIPINDDSIQAAGHHIGDLLFDLLRVVRDVADAAVVLGAAEPRHEVCIDFGCGARIEQRPRGNLAHIAGGSVAVALRGEAVSGAGVVAGSALSVESG